MVEEVATEIIRRNLRLQIAANYDLLEELRKSQHPEHPYIETLSRDINEFAERYVKLAKYRSSLKNEESR